MSHVQDWPSWWDSTRQKWVPVASRVNFSIADVQKPCALCGWGEHMAIHTGTTDEPSRSLGLHKWRAEIAASAAREG